LNFATDAWTSPNHKAFVAVSVHLEHEGKPLAMVLDVVEVAQVGVHNLILHVVLRLMKSQSHSGANLAEAFAKILADFGITDKVSTAAYMRCIKRCSPFPCRY